MKTPTEPSTSKIDSLKSLAKVTQDSIPVSMFDNDQVNHSPGTMKELEESTPKPDGDGTLRRGGNHLKNVAGMEFGRTVNFFFF